MRILLLGGTGAMGQHLVNLLSFDCHLIYITSRSYKESHGNVFYIKGNAKDSNFVYQLMEKKWDLIIDFMVYETEEFKKRFEKILSSCGQYIYLSSSRVYANSKTPLTEKSPRLLDISKDKIFLESDEYSLAKARQENLLFESKFKNWTIVRPYITYSEDRLQLGVLEKEAWLYRALKGRAIAFSQEMLDKKTTLTYGYDVAKAIYSLIGKEKAISEDFHITSNNTLKWSDVCLIYSGVLKERLNVDVEFFYQKIEDFTKWHTSVYQVKYDRFYDREFDNSKISKFIDLNEFISPKVGLDRCLNQFLNKEKFLDINWNSEAIKDKQLNLRASFSEINGLKNKYKYFLLRNIINK